MKNSVLENSVYESISKFLSVKNATMYRDSAPMFCAHVETPVKNRYFIESSQFECSDGSVLPREYALKCIGENHIYKMHDFKSKNDALIFFNNIEFTKNNALILDRLTLAYQVMHDPICNKYHCTERYYNNGYTSLHGSPLMGWLVSYCEGDICIIHCATKSIYDAEVNSHVSFFKENN